jgi:hypothetical protein
MIIGVLSWFDESPSWLAATVTSMARVCSHVVAVDGRYGHYPSAMNASPTNQAETIIEVAGAAGMSVNVYRPSDPFYGGEIEKRNLSFRLAMAVARPMRDWLLVLDGDCVVVEHSDLLQSDLERTEAHTAQVLVEEHHDPLDPDLPIKVAGLVPIANVSRTPITLLYRCLHNIRYEGTHYSIRGEDFDGETFWLWGHDDAVDPFDATSDLVVQHRNIRRPARRREQAAEYYATRELLELEVRPRR